MTDKIRETALAYDRLQDAFIDAVRNGTTDDEERIRQEQDRLLAESQVDYVTVLEYLLKQKSEEEKIMNQRKDGETHDTD